MRHRKSRSFEATISARSGPLFLTDLAFKIPSLSGPGLRDTSPPSSSNNISPLLLTMVENFQQEHKYENFFATRIKAGHDVLDTLVLNHSYLSKCNCKQCHKEEYPET